MQDRVKGPAIALIVVGILGIVVDIMNLVASSMMPSIMRSLEMFNEEQLQQMESMGSGQTVMNLAGAVLVLAGSAFIIFGGMQMMKLRGWPIALVAAILAMIPCFSSCACLLGIPAGIWAIIVLANPEVKAAFAQGSGPQDSNWQSPT
ncbi:MAG: hypothetical protein JNL28_03960 [Planctomycetes bacterium]|nr:hypothetical protein [Planctomycetota bacterium]